MVRNLTFYSIKHFHILNLIWTKLTRLLPSWDYSLVLVGPKVLLPGKSHGRRSLVGCSPWGCWGSDTTFTFMHWRRIWQPTPVFLPGESQGQGSLVDRRLWVGHDWSDLAAAAIKIHGEGNGNPLQYSCLENSLDREPWRATVNGVTKSLSRLSTSAIDTNLP